MATSTAAIAFGDPKIRILIVSMLQKRDFTCIEAERLVDISLGIDNAPQPLTAVFFDWDTGQDGSDPANLIGAIRAHEKGAKALVVGFSASWRDIRARMRARMQNCDDLIALPPETRQIEKVLGLPETEPPPESAPPPPPPPPRASTQEEPPCSEGTRVLIVDDAAVIRVGLSRLLAKFGCVVTEAENGNDALRKLAGARPDLIITDLIMPEMDGFAFMSKVRENPAGRTVPMIVISGYGDKPRLVQALRNGATDFIVKPFRPEVIRQKIANVLKNAG